MGSKPLQYLLIVILLTSLSCVNDNAVVFDTTGDRYFPLQVGNYWKMVPEDPLGYSLDITVTDEVVIHGKNYFKIHRHEVPASPDPVHDWDSYYRMDEDNVVYFLQDSAANIDVSFLRLSAPDGYKWKLSDGYHVTVRVGKDEINGHVLNDCKTFYHYIPGVWDEEFSATYATGIGSIRFVSSFGRTTRLERAVIDGVEYRFDN